MHLLETCSTVCALQLQFLPLYITFFLSFLCLFFFIPPPILFRFFLFSLYLLAVLLVLVSMPCPPLWHHGWLCPIRSAAGEGGEWDAGSSESGAGSHHTVLRPWNVSGTTTINRAASLPPSICHLRTITLKQIGTCQELIQCQKTSSQHCILIDSLFHLVFLILQFRFSVVLLA